MTEITRYRGDTNPDDVLILQPSGAVADLTGYTAVMTINKRENPADNTDRLYQINATFPLPSSGIARFSPSTMQADQVPGVYYFDIQLTDGTGVVRTAVKGKYVYVQDITK